MKFLVEPIEVEQEEQKKITMCALCSEDPRFCNEF